MSCRAKIAGCSEIHTKHINTVCGHGVQILIGHGAQILIGHGAQILIGHGAQILIGHGLQILIGHGVQILIGHGVQILISCHGKAVSVTYLSVCACVCVWVGDRARVALFIQHSTRMRHIVT